jgi:hypothetical protein
VQTKARAKTCTLDSKTNHIVLITTEPLPVAGGQRRGGGRGGPGILDLIVVGR